MSKPKFKKGDRVRCVHELLGAGIDGDFILKEGQEVTVVNPMTEWGSTRVTDGTNEDGWNSDFFEPIPTPTKKHRWTVEEEVGLWNAWMMWLELVSDNVPAFAEIESINNRRTPAAIRSKLYELIRIDEAQP
jgi:hypothetical protein